MTYSNRYLAILGGFYTALLVLVWPLFFIYLVYQRLRRGKYKESLGLRLGLKLPRLPSAMAHAQCLWIHAVSLGETNAVMPLIERLLQAYPDKRIVFSHVTQTGLDQARLILGTRVDHMILPLDFPWLMKRLIAYLRPEILIFVESDWWFNLARLAKCSGVKLAVVNARLSPASYSWYRRARLTRPFWKLFDFVAAQSEEQCQQFMDLGVELPHIRVCGNLKLARDMSPREEVLERFRLFLPSEVPCGDRAQSSSHPASAKGPIIAFGCSHPSEELLAVELIQKLPKGVRIILAPRHPERFDEVYQLLTQRGLDVARWSDPEPRSCQWLLLDAMGCLNEAYHMARLALVGGTWCSHVGGHNILEPVMAGIPAFYGPYFYKQRDFHQLAQSEQLAFCATSEDLPGKVEELLSSPLIYRRWHERMSHFTRSSRKSLESTLHWIWPSTALL